jgi:hypothetical protein
MIGLDFEWFTWISSKLGLTGTCGAWHLAPLNDALIYLKIKLSAVLVDY